EKPCDILVGKGRRLDGIPRIVLDAVQTVDDVVLTDLGHLEAVDRGANTLEEPVAAVLEQRPGFARAGSNAKGNEFAPGQAIRSRHARAEREHTEVEDSGGDVEALGSSPDIDGLRAELDQYRGILDLDGSCFAADRLGAFGC